MLTTAGESEFTSTGHVAKRCNNASINKWSVTGKASNNSGQRCRLIFTKGYKWILLNPEQYRQQVIKQAKHFSGGQNNILVKLAKVRFASLCLNDCPATNSSHVTVNLESRIKQLLPLLESILSSSLFDHLIGWSLPLKNDHAHHSIPIFEQKT